MSWGLIDNLEMNMLGAGVPQATRDAFKARWAVRPVCPTCYLNPQLVQSKQHEQILAKVALGNGYFYHCAKCFGRVDPL